MAKMISTLVMNLSSRPKTRLYPYEERQLPDSSRGHIDFDMEKCIFCTLCAKRCPAGAISVDRKGKTLVFNPYRCIVCEYCIEGCPKDAISVFEQWRAPVVELANRTYSAPVEEQSS